MRKVPATAVSAVWFVLAPGAAAGLGPWWITGWHAHDLGRWWLPVWLLGILLIAAGSAVVIDAFGRFVREGRGTPVPAAAPEQLVVGGLYRYVRNPMYVAVTSVVVGQVLLLARLELLWYAAALAVLFAAFVRLYEEPALRRRFGAQYEEYRRRVPGWIPRIPPRRPSV